MSSIASTRWGSELGSRLSLAALCALAAACAPSSGSAEAPSPAASSKANGKIGGAVTVSTAVEAAAPIAPLPEAGRNGWGAFRGSPRRTGRADVAGPREARVAWSFATGGRVSADAAVSSDGRTIYAASHDGKLYAISADGRLRWSFDTGGPIWTSPVIAPNGLVLVGTDADALVAVDPEGALAWRLGTALPAQKGDKPEAGRYDVDTSPIVLPDGRVVVGCGARLLAATPDAGALAWSFEPGQGADKVFSSPALGRDGTIYFGTQGDRFYAIDGHARVLWTVETGGDVDGAPAVGDDGTIYFGSDDGFVRAAAPGGALRWRAQLGGPVRAPIAIGRDGSVLASTYGGEPFLAALDGATGEERWRFHAAPGDGDFYGIESGALVDADGYVYFGGRDRFVYCLSPRGALVWKHETGDQVDAGPVLGPDGTLYVGSDDGELYAFAR
jgi:outer membrane protein assembly factor BamB